MEDSVKQGAGDDILAMLVRCYESAEQASTDSRKEAERDRDYRNGVQWTAEEVETLKKRKQPVITIDRIGPKVDYLMGAEQQQRSDPRAFPRNLDDEEGAAAATDSLRFVLDQNRWDRSRSESFEQFIVEGYCGADVSVVDPDGDAKITVKPIMWDRMFFDPHSRLRDFSDAKFKGQYIWMDLEDALAQWPAKADQVEATISGESATASETHDDVPRLRWSDPKRKRVRIVEMWSKEDGKVFYSKFCKGGLLDRQESPFMGEDGPEDGFVFGSCYIDRDGNRFGAVRRWISLQDEINKRRSKALHLLNVRQVKYEKGAVADVNAMRRELAKPDGAIEVTPGMIFEPLDSSDMAEAQLKLLQEAKQEIDSVGVNAAMSGTESRVMSGRALLARNEQGQTELGPVFDGFRQWQLDVYRVIWSRVRQFWTAEKWVRVTDNDKNVKFVGLNQPMTLGDQLIEEAAKQGQQITPEMEMQAKMDPRMQQVVGIRNNVGEMDVDIVIDHVPASATLQAEEFATLADLVGKGIPIPPDALIEASSLRGKQKILDQMRGGGKKQEIPPQVKQALEQAAQQIQELQAENQQLKSGVAREQAKGQNAQQIEAMRQASAQALQAMRDDSASVLQAMKDAAAHNREELNAWKDIVLQKMQPPPALESEVSGNAAST